MTEQPENGPDAIPQDFDRLDLPGDFSKIFRNLTRDLERPEPTQWQKDTVKVIHGFDDVVRAPVGYGFFYNTSSSVYQLAAVLSLAPNPSIREIILSEHVTKGERVEMLREKQVLAGLKILDLGSGKHPGFAMAVQALGGRAYTVDAEQLHPSMAKEVSGHVVVDLNDRNAADIIRKGTGGDFDIVAENIISSVPGASMRVKKPEMARIYALGSALLKRGGSMYHSRTLGGQDMLFRKK